MEEIYKLKNIQKVIAEKMGTEELCCQTVEELAELSQVLLTYRRVRGFGQHTDKSMPQTLHGICEELVDSIICIKEIIYMLGLDYDTLEYIEDRKIQRTADRYGMVFEDD